jgi:S1-C subfamily serine protease
VFVLAATAVAVAALAGCSGGDEDATSATTTTTLPEPTLEVEPPAEPPPGVTRSLADTVERVLPSVVNVRTTSFGGGKGEGSGVVLDRRGIIVTNNHVVEGTTSVMVVFNDQLHRRPLAGTVIGNEPERDLAVIRVQATNLVPLPVGRSSTLRLGDAVFAVGFPLGLGGPSVTSGIVSGLDRTIDGPNGELKGLLQTDAAINPGNSGGALVDRFGRLIGINTAVVRLAEAQNVGFAIAIDGALPVITRIRSLPQSSGVWFGVAYGSVDTDAAAVQLGLDASVRGAVVTEVYPGGSGEQAELAVGDVIVAAGGSTIDSAAALTTALAKRKPGDQLELELIDSAGPRLVQVTLTKRNPDE